MLLRKSFKIVFVLWGLVLLGGCTTPSAFSPNHASPTSLPTEVPLAANGALVTLTADKGVAVDPNFIGLSIDLSQVCDIISQDEQDPHYYEQLYMNLGSSIIHIGGHSADFGVWSPGGSMYCSSDYSVVTESMVDAFFAFAARIHWQIVWTLNMIGKNMTAAANEAAYVASVGGSRLVAFSVGNEPDIYAKHGFRPANWGYQQYRAEWEAYTQAVLHQVPGAKFIGSDACCETSFFYNFTTDEGSKILAASHHLYTNIALTGSQAQSIPFILSQAVSEKQADYIQKWVSAARQVGVPLEITESNTFSNGGQLGVSNTYASALWAVDYLGEAAFLGAKKAEMQNALHASYNIIDDNGDPTPLYYGLLFFHQLIHSASPSIESVGMQTTLNMTAYKITDADGTIHLLLINKEASQKADVKFQLNTPSQKAQVLRLAAPSLDATQGQTLGGHGISDKGTWSTPADLEIISITGNVADISVAPGSAAEITFE